jgi:hypothetical protein
MTSDADTTARPLYVRADTPEAELPAHGERPVRMIAPTRRRVAARIIDLLALLMAMMAAISPSFLLTLWIEDTSSDLMLVVIGAGLVLAFGVHIVLRVGRLVWFGCTVGQRVAGIRVVRLADGAERLTWREAFRRWALPRGREIIPMLGDVWDHLRDDELGRCLHDQRAGTVVILDPRREEPGVRARRIALGSVIGITAVALVLGPTVGGNLSRGRTISGEPRFELTTFYDDDMRFENRFGRRAETFVRTAEQVLDDAEGCLAGATGEVARAVLREAGCDGRIEAAFRTPGGVRVGSHLLRFPDPAAAASAAGRLKHTSLRFVPDGPADPPSGGARVGAVGAEDRYVVVTAAVSPDQPEAAAKAENALIMLHTPVLNTIIFL